MYFGYFMQRQRQRQRQRQTETEHDRDRDRDRQRLVKTNRLTGKERGKEKRCNPLREKCRRRWGVGENVSSVRI